MNLDMDLVREILLHIEKQDAEEDYHEFNKDTFPNYGYELVKKHVNMLVKKGYIDGIEEYMGMEDYHVKDLTWDGHQFLKSVRDEKIWKETKSIATKAGGLTLDVIKSVATELISIAAKAAIGAGS